MQDMLKMMYILAETDDTSGISLPLKSTNRIKFLTFAASETLIVFGATSGGLYVYDRETYNFKSLVPSKEGPVTCVQISPDEKWFGFSSARGLSCVLEHHGSSVNRRILSHVHEGKKVTALQWNNNSTQLYVGDDTGQISVISVSSYLTPAVALMQLDSAIIQLDTCSYMLLASTFTRSYLCDTFREQYRQIGNRLRDGEFGSCFYDINPCELASEPLNEECSNQEVSHGPFSSLSDGEWLLTDKHLQNIKLFCARPGLRLWEVRIDGAVMSTHQFKQLQSTQPVKVLRPPNVETLKLHDGGNHMLQFRKLCKVSNKFIITYDSIGMCILDPLTSEIILWSNEFKNIADVKVVKDTIYIWMGESRLHAIQLTPIDKFLVRMYLQKRFIYCAQLCAAHVNVLKKLAHVSSRMHILSDLLHKIKDEENALDEVNVKRIQELLDEVAKNAQNRDQAQMLNSGIFIVGNAHLLSQKDEFRALKQPDQAQETLRLPNYLLKQENQPQNNALSDKGTHSGIFQKTILPSMSSLPFIPDQSNLNSDDYDPFPDLPLSSLTSTETIMALKNLTTSVSGTISNGTKSLKEKWQNLEEKLGWQEEIGLSTEKSINRPDVRAATSSDGPSNDYEEKNDFIKRKDKVLKLPVSSFMRKCCEILDDNSMTKQDSVFEMLECFGHLYRNFRLATSPQTMPNNCIGEDEGLNNYQQWLKSREIIPFPFQDHFEKEFLASLSKIFHRCLALGYLTNWLLQFIPHLDLDHSLFPSHIGRIYDKKSLLLDQALGRCLRIWSNILDAHSALQSLESSSCPCQYFSWNVIMDHFHSSPNVPSHSLDSESPAGWSLPHTLNAMLVMFQLGQVESCKGIGKHISLKNVLRTVLRMKEDPSLEYSLFLSYLEKVPSEEVLKNLDDTEIYYYVRYAYESLHTTTIHSQCDCGFPLDKVKLGKTYPSVGKSLLFYINKNEGLSEAIKLCQKTNVLWYHLLVLRRKEALAEVLPLILHLSCEEELKSRQSELSNSVWDLIFQLRVKIQEAENYCQDLKGDLLESQVDVSSLPVISPSMAERLDLPSCQERHHWGLKVDLLKSHCFFCMLPLSSSSGGSVISFYCKHSFHSVCAQKQLLKKCPICAKI
ncbi:Hermansky-Pudlak syndrome 5 protein-like protein [Frankliniella fusca]|uniref:Hermansky-Pudlak syndrome 5 protein-like protein n=1 Tax=Frankliniella fusca TaxID=407009 RepID=A0AAE1LJH1_9NEOP|nr:Hermansky-Pudlak syndrome 5 protein-like protein [Frankliniella fusca]